MKIFGKTLAVTAMLTVAFSSPAPSAGSSESNQYDVELMKNKRNDFIHAVKVLKQAQVDPMHEPSLKANLLIYAPLVSGVGGAGLLAAGGFAVLNSTVIGAELGTGFSALVATSGLLFIGGAVGTVIGVILPKPTTKSDTVTEYLKTNRGLTELFQRDAVSIVRTVDSVGDQELIDLVIDIAKKIEEN